MKTYTDLLQAVKDLDISNKYMSGGALIEIAKDCLKVSSRWREEYTLLDRPDVKELKDNILYMQHSTGGVSGGSCWDSSDPQPYTNSEPIPEFEDLYNVLEKVNPNLSFFNVRKIIKDLVKQIEYEDREYYGNCTNYIVKYVHLKDLYNYMKKNDML